MNKNIIKFNKNILRELRGRVMLFMVSALALTLASCDKTESYSELLRDEERAVNWYLAGNRVEMEVPVDSIFEIGKDAPFYRMDSDGHVYMQVVNAGDMNDRPQDGDKVYFRYMRTNLKLLYENGVEMTDGNMDNFASSSPTGFFKGNTLYPSSTQFGTGIQLPMNYLGYYSEVNLVMKSYVGFASDQSQCIPYLINIKYYKPEY